MGTQYLIIGGSAAGMAAAHTLRVKDPSGQITVLSNEKSPPYFRPMIPYIIMGKKSVTDIALSGSGIFTTSDIDVRLDAPAWRLDTQKQCVETKNNDLFFYDKLLIAAGSRPYMPQDIDGLDAPGVFCIRTVADAVGIAKRVESTDHAVMLGGGILNLKGAFALLEKGLKVTLVVYSPEILSQLMDPEDAWLVREALGRAGLEIITGCSATAIETGRDGVSAVHLDNGGKIACQMVCVGKGVVPNTDFMTGSGISIDKGIVTNPFTAASRENIYAAGDIAVTVDPGSGEKTVTSLWTHAVEMGRCAGLNMAGIPTPYAGTFGIMNATQVAGEPFVSMGMVHTRGTGYEVHRESSKKTYRKIVFSPDGERLIGALFIGDITGAGLYRYIIREKRQIRKIKSHLIHHTLHYGHLIC